MNYEGFQIPFGENDRNIANNIELSSAVIEGQTMKVLVLLTDRRICSSKILMLFIIK